MTSKIVDIQQEDWQRIVGSSNKPVVVEFWHHNCPHCKGMEFIYTRMPGKFDESVVFTRINILESEDNRLLLIKNGVFGTPIFKVYFRGKEVGEVVGVKTEEKLREELGKILDSIAYV